MISLFAILATASGAYLQFTLLAPADEAAPSTVRWSEAPRADPALAWPGYGAGAVGAVGFAGTLEGYGGDEPRPIASLSKVVTALVVLAEHPLQVSDAGPRITFSAADAALYGSYLGVRGKVAPMQAGQSLSQREVLDVVLVSSANNYADVLAQWAFGSREAFVAAAGAWIAARGLTGTTITEPTGLSPLNVSTPTDLVEIGKLAVADPVVSSIVATTSLELPSVGLVENTNDLLGLDGVDGIKTGTLDEAGACLLFSADYTVGTRVVTVVGVVLGGPDHDTLDLAVRALLDRVDDGFHEVRLTTRGDELATFTTEWGETASAVAEADASALVWGDAPIEATVTVRGFSTARAGEQVGSAEFDIDAPALGVADTEVALVVDEAVRGPSAWWRLTHPAELLD